MMIRDGEKDKEAKLLVDIRQTECQGGKDDCEELNVISSSKTNCFGLPMVTLNKVLHNLNFVHGDTRVMSKVNIDGAYEIIREEWDHANNGQYVIMLDNRGNMIGEGSPILEKKKSTS